MAGKRKPLEPKQRRFAEEYLKDLNATKAALRAGYSRRSAKSQASRLLIHPGVVALVERGMVARSVRTGITQDRVLRELELLSFSDVSHYTVDDGGELQLTPAAPEGAMRAIKSVKHRIITHGNGKDREVTHELEYRLWDKPGPLKLSGNHVGILKDGDDAKRPLTGSLTVKFGGRYKPSSAGASK